MPLISVIIPVYNGENTIRETIESVLNQTFKDFELIVINDGSTDSTLDVVSNIQDSRLKVFSYPNAKQAASRNRGLSQATGEYVSFIDADDLWKPDKLEAQLKALQENPEAGVAYSWTDLIDESGNFIRGGANIYWQGESYARMLLNDFVESGSNPLIRAQAIKEVGNFDESLPPAEDWDMWIRLASRYPFVVVPSAQVLYRVRANSSSTNVSKMEAVSLRIIERAYAEAPASIQHLKRHTLGNRYKYLVFKALEEPPVRQKALTAIRFLWQAFIYDPVLLRRRIIWKVLLRIAIIVLLPSKLAQTWLNKFKQFTDILTLVILIRVDIVPAQR
ncbi:glycosyltransferase [Argonema galeatum]|uniref:glycosyltransferase n=1 Tax=Argonema galeatum TaxID=2942762 RepID=UPI002013654F|nr:glycosyltransferase [Argonema galeatum]MCL1464459.1 glycosyltransferase [Argonema galeatum A003/A1]